MSCVISCRTRENPVSNVLLSRQVKTFRLYQSRIATKYRFPEKGVHYAAKGSGDDSIFAMTFATDLVVHLKGCAC